MVGHGIVFTWGDGACYKVCLSGHLLYHLHKEQVCHRGEALPEVRSALSLWVLIPLLHWPPLDHSILRDHCQPHSEFLPQTACIIMRRALIFSHCWHLRLYNMVRMSWNLLRFLKVFQKTLTNSSSQTSFCPPLPKIHVGRLMTNL